MIDRKAVLRPCPFCGAEVTLRSMSVDQTVWMIECGECYMEAAIKLRIDPSKGSNHDDLIRGWNRRTGECISHTATSAFALK